jgi:RNA polymerase sigma factor (sigma-70 family)
MSNAEVVRIEHLLRELAPQVLGAVMRRHRDFAACEDAVQEALIAATNQWPREGQPANPRGWLIQIAMRRMTDHIRSEIARRSREHIAAEDTPLVVAPALYNEPAIDPDDTLVLLFMCCHPVLSSGSAIALTLRAVGGLTTAEIAKAFLVPEATMAQRISRAKQTVKDANIVFELPDADARAERLGSVLHVLYLIFNEGYTSSSGPELQRTDLSNEAIRLVRALHTLLPSDYEIAGLLALMLLTDARRAARTGVQGELIPLDEQDRSLWNSRLITEGTALVSAVLPEGHVGPYQIQAAIAAVHDEAKRPQDTDWPQILALYEVLMRMTQNPVVALNRAVAVAMVHGPDAGLSLLDPLEGKLRESHRVDAVRAHLLERNGAHEEAAKYYRAAATKTTSIPERNYLAMRASRLSHSLLGN